MPGLHSKRLFLVALLPFIAACGPSLRSSVPVTHPTPPAASQVVAEQVVLAPAPPPADDPVLTLIGTSDRHFKTGQQELEQGHVSGAKAEFDHAIEVLLESPFGARSEPRLREHFDRLVDRISAYELRALATGDGFTEAKNEPASIDELLALSDTLV